MTEFENPGRVLVRPYEPILSPDADYEKRGFFGNVVFTCGAIPYADGCVVICYGASDEYTCAVETIVGELLDSLR